MADSRVSKQEFIDRIAEEAKISKKDAGVVLNATISVIEKAMKQNESIVIPGFGSFKVQKVKARKGRNVQTGEEIKIPAKNRVKFTAGAKLKEVVNKKKK